MGTMMYADVPSCLACLQIFEFKFAPLRYFGLKLIDDDDDQDETIIIGNNWPSKTTLKVDIINNFDGDQSDEDPAGTDHNGTKIFHMNICE